MANPPKKSQRAPRAKAARPDVTPLDEHLSALLNPALTAEKPRGEMRGMGEAPQATFVTDGPAGFSGATATVSWRRPTGSIVTR